MCVLHIVRVERRLSVSVFMFGYVVCCSLIAHTRAFAANDSTPVCFTFACVCVVRMCVCVCVCATVWRSLSPATDAEFAALRHFHLTHVHVSGHCIVQSIRRKIKYHYIDKWTRALGFNLFCVLRKCFKICFFFFFILIASQMRERKNNGLLVKHIQKHIYDCICCV